MLASATSGFLGDGRTAVRQGEQGVRLSPLDARSFWHEGLLGQAHYVNGDFEQALEWARSSVSRNGLIRFTQRLLIATLSALGRREEAAEAARRYLASAQGLRVEGTTLYVSDATSDDVNNKIYAVGGYNGSAAQTNAAALPDVASATTSPS